MIWWIIATIAAFFIKGLCGFANTLVFTSILSFGNSNVNISPVELILGYPANMILAWKERKSISWNVCVPLALLVVVSSIPGVMFLKNADTRIIKLFFGAVIIFIGLEMLFREYQTKKMKQSKVVLGIIGVVSGLLCGLYGIGALLGAYVSRVTDDSSAFKANICVVFLMENTFRIVLYALWEIITFDVLKQAMFLIPLMITGLILGMFSGKYLDEKIIRKLVIFMLIVSGAVLILHNL